MTEIKAASNTNTIEQTIYYAQLINDTFAQAVSANGCTLVIPMTMYMEIEQRKDQINTYVDVITDQDTDDKIIDDTSTDDTTNTEQVIVAENMARSVHDKCINCKLEIPEFDFGGDLKGAIEDIADLIYRLKEQFKYRAENMCHFTFALNYMCIPDLIRLLAMILAMIAKIIAMFFIGSFSITMMIMGIIGAILKMLMKAISAIIKIALSPIMCFINALEDIVNTLPTPENINRQIPKDQLSYVGLDNMSDSGINNKFNAFKEETVNVTDRIRKGVDGVNKIFDGIIDRLQESLKSLQDSVEDMLGIKTHFECEGERSTQTVGDWLGKIMSLMALANLIINVVKKKSLNKAKAELCNPKGFTDPSSRDTSDDAILTTDQMIDVISETLDRDVIVATENDEVVGIILKDPEKVRVSSTRLTLFDCNLKNVIKDNNMNTIIAEAIDFANLELVGNGNNPSTTRVVREDISTIGKEYDIIPFDPNDESLKGLLSTLDETFSFLEAYNAATGVKQGNLSIGNRGEKKFEVINNKVPEIDQGNETVDNVINVYHGYNTIMPGDATTRTITLQCGTVENLSSTLNALENIGR